MAELVCCPSFCNPVTPVDRSHHGVAFVKALEIVFAYVAQVTILHQIALVGGGCAFVSVLAVTLQERSCCICQKSLGLCVNVAFIIHITRADSLCTYIFCCTFDNDCCYSSGKKKTYLYEAFF